MQEYPKGGVKEKRRMLEGRWMMLDVAIRIHMSKEIRNLGVFDVRRKREDGRGFDVRRMMEDVRCCHPDSCLLSISFIYALTILSKEIRNLGESFDGRWKMEEGRVLLPPS